MTGNYNSWLVSLSFLVAFCVSYTALQLVSKVTASSGRGGFYWLVGGAFAMGVGIWSMHFIGMLAFTLPIPIAYHVPKTLGSLLIAIAVSGFALAIASGKELSQLRLAVSAVLMGLGIAGMHYSGMAAILITPAITYETSLFITSIAIAMAASYAALWIAFNLRAASSRRAAALRLGAAAIMAVAITGMHYTGMSASRFALNSYCLGTATNNGWLAITIACFALGLLAITLTVSVYDAYLDARVRRHHIELARAHAQMVHAATHDTSTGLPNRALFKELLGDAIAAARNQQALAVLSINLANMKSIAESLSREAADTLRKQVAERLKTKLRNTELLAYCGSDGFLLLIKEDGDRGAATEVAHRVLDLLRAPFQIAQIEVHASTALGISLFPQDGADPENLLIAADAAQFQSSKMGGNTYQFFNREMTSAMQARLELEHGLRQALLRNELELHYQPKVMIASNRIAGVEALVRWRRPGHGLVMPGKFVALAEETGLITPIGDWVLNEACRQARAWQVDGHIAPLRVAVNLAAQQFHCSNLLDTIQQSLRSADLEPRYLGLELTESAVMSNAEESARILAELSRLGVSISIDDFGTGYSSLSYLKRFPLDRLKIDRSFVRDLPGNHEDAAIVRAIISLAHSLKLKVIAEGVENGAQLELLRKLGCDQYQGYYCSAPLRAAALELFLQTRWSTATDTEHLDPLATVSRLFIAR